MSRFNMVICLRSILDSILLLGVLVLLLTMVLFFTDVSEAILPFAARLGQMAAVFIGSLLAAKRAGSKGLFYAAAIAGVMLLFLMLVGGLCLGSAPTVGGVVAILLAGFVGGLAGIGLSAI